jgi:hypothetical protein
MKRTILASAALACLFTGPLLRADSKDDISPTVSEPAETNIPISQEFDLEGSYEGGAEMKQGKAKLGEVDNTYGHANYVISPQINEGVLLRFGLDAERNSFGLPNNAPLPNTLQSVNAVIGADFTASDKIIIRAEIHPGLYSDFVDISSSDFDCPVQIGGTYLWSKDFQIIFGMQVDLRSNIPIIGIPGFRWQFADKWVIEAIPPRPQLQYQVSNAVTLYAGSEIINGTYHLNEDFGNYHGHNGPGTNNSELNGNIVDYTEVRAGLGCAWKFTPNMTLDVSGGYVPYREYDLHRDRIGFSDHDTIFHNNLGSGGFYSEVGVKGSF